MGKKPQIPHQIIVDYILAGNTTKDAKAHFRFASDNIANLRVHAAFKALKINRPRFKESRKCEFCGSEFTTKRSNRRTCGKEKCQNALILDWQKQNKDKVKQSLKKYRSTEKGRQNNLRMHRKKRFLGLNGSIVEQWNFAATEIKKSIRKRCYLAFRNQWEYRVQHIQKLAKLVRAFTPRKPRTIRSTEVCGMWLEALRAVQTTTYQIKSNASSSEWEKTVIRINGALRTRGNIRKWQKVKKPYR